MTMVILGATALKNKADIPAEIDDSLSREEFESRYDIVTLQETVDEIAAGEDTQTTTFIQNCPYKLRIVKANDMIDATDVLKIEAFAREATYLNLSDVEKLTIAAGFTTAKRNGEASMLKEHPQEMEVFKKANSIRTPSLVPPALIKQRSSAIFHAKKGDFKIPVIDLEASTDEELTSALETTGFFYLKQKVISEDEFKNIF